MITMHFTQQQRLADEERQLMRVIEESKNSADPNNPDIDNMTYEQLLDMGDAAGKVSKGLSAQ